MLDKCKEENALLGGFVSPFCSDSACRVGVDGEFTCTSLCVSPDWNAAMTVKAPLCPACVSRATYLSCMRGPPFA